MLWVSLLVRLRVEMPKIGLVQIDPDVSLLVRLRVEIQSKLVNPSLNASASS